MPTEMMRMAHHGVGCSRTIITTKISGKILFPSLLCAVLLFCVASKGAPVNTAHGQTPESNRTTTSDTPMIVAADALNAATDDRLFLLPSRIRVRLGDVPACKEPEFKDDDWAVLDALRYPDDAPNTDRSSTPVWFRFQLQFDPTLIGHTLLFQAVPYQDNVQVFLNGVEVAGPQDIDPSTSKTPRCFVPRQTSTIVALRWVPNKQMPNLDRRKEPPRVFSLAVRDYARTMHAFDRARKVEQYLAWHRIALTALFFASFLFHLALYANYPLRRENIFYCSTALLCALSLTALHVSEVCHYDRALWRIAYLYFFQALMPLSLISALALFQVVLLRRIQRLSLLYVPAGILSFVAGLYLGNVPMHLFPILMLPAFAWVVWRGRGRAKALLGWWSLPASIVMLIVMMSAVASLYQWNSGSGFLRYAPWYFSVVFLQIISVAFTREYAYDKKRIETFAAGLEAQVTARTQELLAATTEIKTLQGILPICMYCHKIRNDQRSWQQLEQYIQQHADVAFSHGLCPDCMKRHYPDLPPRDHA